MRQPPSYSLRLAWRSLLRARAATMLAMATLGIGLAAAVALLGVVDSGARTLPAPDGGRVVELEVRDARAQRITPPAPVTDWTHGQGIVLAGALQQAAGTLTHERARAQYAYGAAMHPAVLRLLQVDPVVGRIPSDDAADENAIVVGWDLWHAMGADLTMLGTQIDVDGRPHTLIGVMPAGFGFPERQSFWTVLPAHESGEVVARIADDVAIETAARAVQTRLDAHALGLGLDAGPHRVIAQPWTRSRDAGGEGVALAALGSLVLLLLLVCAANVATLLLVRGTERAGILAVHAALGATRAQVTAQLFLEAALITVGGGILGIAGGFAMLRWMQLNLAQHWGYYWMAMEVRPPVLLATLALVLVTALLAGTAPAVRAARVDIARVLVGTGRGGYDPARRRLGSWFVGAQVTLSTLGLIAAVFLAWQFQHVGNIAERLPVDDVAVGAIVLPQDRSAEDRSHPQSTAAPDRYDDPTARAALVADLRAALGRIDGVTDVSITGAIPGGSSGSGPLRIADAVADAPVAVTWVAADAAMTDVYRMRVVAGRTFDERDTRAAAPVIVVTAAFARAHFDGNAVGRSVRIEGLHADDRWAEIVGVVDDWFPEQTARSGPVTHRVFVPLDQASAGRLYFSLDTDGEPRRVLGDVRGAVARVDRRLPVDELQTLDDRMRYYTRMYRVIAGFGLLGGIGSALVAGIGLYGVMSFQVRLRRREIGIRMAVGAARSVILREIIRDSLRRVVPGLALGLALALAAAPLLGNARQASPLPALLFAAALVTFALLAIGIAAAAEPALRASRLDPQEVLRTE